LEFFFHQKHNAIATQNQMSPLTSFAPSTSTQGFVHWMNAMAEHMTSNPHNELTTTAGRHYMWNGLLEVSLLSFIHHFLLNSYLKKKITSLTVGCSKVIKKNVQCYCSDAHNTNNFFHFFSSELSLCSTTKKKTEYAS
jgi:hypothetical protein